jgi:hypothetical protein
MSLDWVGSGMDSLLKDKALIGGYSKSIFDINAFKEAIFLNQKGIQTIDFLDLDENFEINNSNSRFFSYYRIISSRTIYLETRFGKRNCEYE